MNITEYFSTLAAKAGVEWCPLPECEYLGGYEGAIVHMAEPKRFTKRKVYDFLHYAWISREDIPVHDEKWKNIYERAIWIQSMAREAQTRLPRDLFAIERARLREALSEYASRVPKFARPPGYEVAQRWARE